MSRFTFICEDEPMPFSDGIVSKKTVEFNGESLDSIVNEFEMFLKGCGFSFNGQLDFVDDHSNSFDYGEEPPEWHTEEFETPKFDFSEIQKLNWPFPRQTEHSESSDK